MSNYDPEARFNTLRDRLSAIEADFPDFFINFWSPQDYVEALTQMNMPVPTGEALESFSCAMSEMLHDNFDAEAGVNWQILKWTAIDANEGHDK